MTCGVLATCVLALTLSTSGIVTHVRDADTIEVDGQAIRLNGIDAPELDTAAGHAARGAMQALVQGRQVECTLTGERSYDRLVGTCYLNGTDIGAEMIRRGVALDCPRYSGGRYASIETPAARLSIRRAGYCKARR